jgi:hypothetical protein
MTNEQAEMFYEAQSLVRELGNIVESMQKPNRAQIAAMAMQGILTGKVQFKGMEDKISVERASVKLADALIAELERIK